MAETPEALRASAPEPPDYAGRLASEPAASREESKPQWWHYLPVALFVIFVGAAVLSGPLISAPLLRRIPDDWSWQANFVGRQKQADANTGQFGEWVSGTYHRLMSADGAGSIPGSVKIVDDYLIKDPLTGETVWRYTTYPLVDPETGMRAEPEFRSQYFVFPRNVEQRTYELRQSYLKGIPMRFVGEDTIEGMAAYLFEYVGRGEYTESYAGSAEYPGVAVAPGQEIKCADDQFYLRMWVEPLSGEALKIAEGCESGDYVYDVATGEPVTPVLLWSGQTEGSDVVTRVSRIHGERLRILVASYLPLGFAVLAIIFGVMVLMKRRGRA